MSVKLSMGNKKKVYKSIREASVASGIPYITLYMRVTKLGWSIPKAVKAGVRKYTRKVEVEVDMNEAVGYTPAMSPEAFHPEVMQA